MVGNAHLNLLDAEGTRMGGYFVGELAVTGSRPSTLHPGLVDVTVRLWCDDALPQSGRVWDLIRTGRLDRKGLWRSLGPAGRRAWLSVALFSRGYRPRGDAPAGQVFTLDGRHIMDEDSFYCALGEAVNGPGGYFGWNTAALDDCLTGRWGLPPRSHWSGTARNSPGRDWPSPIAATATATPSSRLRWRSSVTMASRWSFAEARLTGCSAA